MKDFLFFNPPKGRIYMIWNLVACILLLICLLTACGSPATEEQANASPDAVWSGDFSVELPEGYTISRDERGNQVYSDGNQTIGGMTIRTIPEGFEITEYFKKDFLIALGVAEAADDSLGYSGGGSPGGMGSWGWVEEYFSDVSDPKDRTVHTSHQFFIMSDETTVLDFWIDLMFVDNVTKDRIFESIEIPEIERYRQEPPPVHTIPQDAPYEITELPERYSLDILGERCILIIRDNQHPVAGMDVIKIPDGAYDPDNPDWSWIEKARLSDYQNPEFIQYLGGMTYGDHGWVAEFANEQPEGHPWRVHRRHIYHVIGSDLYDLWFDMHWLTQEEAETLSEAVRFLEP